MVTFKFQNMRRIIILGLLITILIIQAYTQISNYEMILRYLKVEYSFKIINDTTILFSQSYSNTSPDSLSIFLAPAILINETPKGRFQMFELSENRIALNGHGGRDKTDQLYLPAIVVKLPKGVGVQKDSLYSIHNLQKKEELIGIFSCLIVNANSNDFIYSGKDSVLFKRKNKPIYAPILYINNKYYKDNMDYTIFRIGCKELFIED